MTARTIALDYDDTYTACPAMWDRVVPIFKAHGFRVLVVTCRCGTDENVEKVKVPGCSVVFTDHQPKRDYLKHKRGIEVDIWIDDYPEAILHGR